MIFLFIVSMFSGLSSGDTVLGSCMQMGGWWCGQELGSQNSDLVAVSLLLFKPTSSSFYGANTYACLVALRSWGCAKICTGCCGAEW